VNDLNPQPGLTQIMVDDLRLDHAPIILAHGLFGFDRVGVGRVTVLEYFREIPQQLRRWGYRVHAAKVHPTASIFRRAARLGEQIESRFPGEPVHVIAHSMGGLDARMLLQDDAWADRILSLTTIGTPHCGSSLAEQAQRRLGPMYRILRAIGWDHQGVLDIVPDCATAWHERTLAPEGTACYSVAGNPEPSDVCWPLRLPHAMLLKQEGPNDGLVSVTSATSFGTPLAIEPIDHLRQMNWCTRFPANRLRPRVHALYGHILTTIAAHDPSGRPAAAIESSAVAASCVGV
jgi:triacylglycerol lipase